MNGDQVVNTGITERTLPAPRNLDGAQSGIRIGGYDEQYVLSMWPTKHVLADEGSYFVATNPTPGTAITFAVNASYDVTKNLFVFVNTDQPNGKRMYLDYIKLICDQAPASATVARYAIAIDYINRYTSGGTKVGAGGTAAAYNVNGDITPSGIGQCIYATSAVITSPAAGSSVRIVSTGVLRSVIPAVNDEMVLTFGSVEQGGGSSATAAGRTVTACPPVILGPGQSAVLTVWFPSNSATALTYEFEAGWIER